MNAKLIGIAFGACGIAVVGGVLAYRTLEPRQNTGEPLAIETPATTTRQAPTTAPKTSSGDVETPEPGGKLPDWRQYDIDGDGSLSKQEKASMLSERKASWLANLDTDGDGVLSVLERWAPKRDWLDSTAEGRRYARRFDLNADGKIDDAELADLIADSEQGKRDELERMLRDFDLDGDGALNDVERSLAREAFTAERERQKAQVTAHFDSDEDGVLSPDEWRRLDGRFRSAKERSDFRERYDTNTNGSVDTADFDAFISLYAQSSILADVNYDGVVDQSDLQRFRDLMIEHEIAGEEELDLQALFGKNTP